MKKITLILFTFFIVTINTLAYEPSTKDINNINKIHKKIDVIYKKNPDIILKLEKQINKTKDSYKNNEKIYFLLSSIEKYIWNIENNKTNNNEFSVIEVIDGDTFYFTWSDNKKKKVRMIWIDAPEKSKTRYWYTENFWTWAEEKLKELIEWKIVKLEYDKTQWKTDKYWRILAYVFVWNTNINQKMIELWYAKEYTYNKKYKYQKKFLKAQENAKNDKIWIWKKVLEEKKSTSTKSSINNSYKVTNIKKYSTYRNYYKWKRWWCYYYNSNWNKTYVSRSLCN